LRRKIIIKKGDEMTKKLSFALLAIFAASLLAANAAYAQCPMAGKAGCPSDNRGNADMEMPKFTPESHLDQGDRTFADRNETKRDGTHDALEGR
jgi:hypothetical protein